MKEGAFALIDCLGFKGIWERYDAQVVIDKLINIDKTIKRDISTSPTSLFELIRTEIIIPKITLLSDTVAISVTYNPNLESTEGLDSTQLVGALCFITPIIIDYFIDTEPHLLMRGCITFGEHISQENFIIGRAVDEAAENEKIANGAFVWLTSQASEKYKQYIQNLIESLKAANPEFVKSRIGDESKYQAFKTASSVINDIGFPPLILENYEMPIKNNKSMTCSVINPFNRKMTTEERKRTVEIYYREMSKNVPDVITKRENTMKFLESAEKQVEQYGQSLGNLLSMNPDLVERLTKFGKSLLIQPKL